MKNSTIAKSFLLSYDMKIISKKFDYESCQTES